MRSKGLYLRWLGWPLVLFALLALATVACNNPFTGGPYEETFDNIGSWGIGADADAEGDVRSGQYVLLVKADLGLFWSTAGEDYGDGVYAVEATQLSGPLDNGYGMIFRMDVENDNFYLFEVSGDGFIWIGKCSLGCEETAEPIIGEGWFDSEAVNTGLNNPNRLRVRAEGANLIFFVNDQEVGRVTDDTYARGDIGILVESLGEGGVEVAFDNFTITPLENSE
jgi:hypothetical protein